MVLSESQGSTKQEPQKLRAENGYLSSSREHEFALPLPFYSIQGLGKLDDDSILGGPSALSSLPMRMLIFQKYP
jgi:hypothetical protein